MSSLNNVLTGAEVHAPIKVVATVVVVVVVREAHPGATIVFLHADMPVEEDPIFLELIPESPKYGSTKLQGEDGCHPRTRPLHSTCPPPFGRLP